LREGGGKKGGKGGCCSRMFAELCKYIGVYVCGILQNIAKNLADTTCILKNTGRAGKTKKADPANSALKSLQIDFLS